MLKKNKTRLFRHFITCVNIIACAVPLIVLCFNILHDFFPKYLTSLGMQHHGSNDDFSEDLSLLSENSQLRDFNTNALSTLDTLGYLDYNESTIITKNVYQTNVVSTADDLVIGNVYQIEYTLTYGSNYDIYLCRSSVISFIPELINYNVPTSASVIVRTYVASANTAIGRLVESSDNSIVYYYFGGTASMYSNDKVIIPFIYNGGTISDLSIIKQADLSMITPTYTEETNEITSFEGWLTATNGKQLSYIMDNNVNQDSLFLKINFLSLFGIDVTNVNNSVATYLFINYYINYFITITLILFLPQLIFIFIDWVRELLYKFTDVEDRT